MSEITGLLELCSNGDTNAKDKVYSALYNDLTRLARSQLARSGPLTLDPSSIVHEAWLRSAAITPPSNRQQFFAYASACMRSVIVDHIRERRAQKRGGGRFAVTLTTAVIEECGTEPDVLDLDDALKKLEKIDLRSHDVVQMRFFGGMKYEEIADALSVSTPTVKRDLVAARAFLFKCFAQ